MTINKKNGFKIFISYAIKDLEFFKIEEMAKLLEADKKIDKVFYWNRDNDADLSIVEYMEEKIVESDCIIAYSSENSLNSQPITRELDMAVLQSKQIIPVFLEIKHVREILQPYRGIKIVDQNQENIAEEILTLMKVRSPRVIIEKNGLQIDKQDSLFLIDFENLHNEELLMIDLEEIKSPNSEYLEYLNSSKDLVKIHENLNETNETINHAIKDPYRSPLFFNFYSRNNAIFLQNSRIVGIISRNQNLPNSITNLKSLIFYVNFGYASSDLNISNPNLQCICLNEFSRNFLKRNHDFPNLESLTLNFLDDMGIFTDFLNKNDKLKYIRFREGLGGFNVNLKHLMNCKNIEEIEIFECNVKEIPENIGKLTNLKELILWDCKIREIPKSIGNLPNLMKLILLKNAIEKIPKNLGNLSNLIELDLSYNFIDKLPNSIGQLEKLKKLNLEYCYLSQFNLELEKLHNLEELNLNSNNISEFPFYKNLLSIKLIDLSGNNLKEFPTCLLDFPTLEKIKLNYNNITEIPLEILSCKSLKVIEIFKNPLNFKSLKILENLMKKGILLQDKT